MRVVDHMQVLIKRDDPKYIYYHSNSENLNHMMSALVTKIVGQTVFDNNKLVCLKWFRRESLSRHIALIQCRQTGKTETCTLLWAAYLACGIATPTEVSLLCAANSESLAKTNLSDISFKYEMFMTDFCKYQDEVRNTGTTCQTKFKTKFTSSAKLLECIHFRNGQKRIAKAHDKRGVRPNICWSDEHLFMSQKDLAAIQGFTNVLDRTFIYTSTPNDKASSNTLKFYEENKRKNAMGQYDIFILDKGLVCDKCRLNAKPEACMHAFAYTPPFQSRLAALHKVINAADKPMQFRETLGISVGASLMCIDPTVLDELKSMRRISNDLIFRHCTKSLLYVGIDPPLDHSSHFGVSVFVKSNDGAAQIILGVVLYKFPVDYDLQQIKFEFVEAIQRIRDHPLAFKDSEQKRRRVLAPIIESQGGGLLCDHLLDIFAKFHPCVNIMQQDWAKQRRLQRARGFATTESIKQDMFKFVRNVFVPQHIKLFFAESPITIFGDKIFETEINYLLSVCGGMRQIDNKYCLDSEFRDDSFMGTFMPMYMADTRIYTKYSVLYTKVPTHLHALQLYAFEQQVHDYVPEYNPQNKRLKRTEKNGRPSLFNYPVREIHET